MITPDGPVTVPAGPGRGTIRSDPDSWTQSRRTDASACRLLGPGGDSGAGSGGTYGAGRQPSATLIPYYRLVTVARRVTSRRPARRRPEVQLKSQSRGPDQVRGPDRDMGTSKLSVGGGASGAVPGTYGDRTVVMPATVTHP
eukprot:27588-Hanusia_phi.AAC.1